MTEKSQYHQAVETLQTCRKALVTSHVRPDGDAIGSIKAVSDILEHLGKQCTPLLLSPLPSWYDFVYPAKVPVLGDDVKAEQLDEKYADCDLVIIVDTNSAVQLPGIAEWIKNAGKKVFVIDHHITGEGLGDVELVDTTAAATGEVIYDLLRYAQWPLSSSVAEALFVAYCTDSGWFRFGNADGRLFRTAADLVDAGVKPYEIYRKLFQNYSPSRLKLMVRMLESLELHHDGKVAIQHILRKDFDETGARGSDTENLIDECQKIGTVEMAVMLVELGENPRQKNKGFRASLRSKGHFDVRAIAQNFGGGGHTVAAGANIEGTLDEVKSLILQETEKQL